MMTTAEYVAAMPLDEYLAALELWPAWMCELVGDAEREAVAR